MITTTSVVLSKEQESRNKEICHTSTKQEKEKYPAPVYPRKKLVMR